MEQIGLLRIERVSLPKIPNMTRKKGVYDLVYFTTKASSKVEVTGANWKEIQDKLNKEYKDYMSVKDLEHTTEPFFKVVTSGANPASKKEIEEYFYTKKK
jgi:hypothetical protein